jgi:hypothetical protein
MSIIVETTGHYHRSISLLLMLLPLELVTRTHAKYIKTPTKYLKILLYKTRISTVERQSFSRFNKPVHVKEMDMACCLLEQALLTNKILISNTHR